MYMMQQHGHLYSLKVLHQWLTAATVKIFLILLVVFGRMQNL
jgi:hypothetical protein